MKRYIVLINILLLTVGIFAGVKIFYKIVPEQLDHDTQYREIYKTAPSLEDKISKPLSYYNTITERNLFNTKKGNVKTSEQIDIEALKQTELKLKLLGTVTGDEKRAYAVIQEEKEKQQYLYRIGDTIQKATLKIILREKIILNVNGKDEVLEIEEIRSTGAGRITRRTSRARTTSSRQNITLNRSQIEDAVKNVNNLMKQVNIQPHFKNGKPDGLRLTRVQRNSIFNRMGLKRGDIITGVDGEKIESVDDALALYNKLKNASNVKLEIKRRGVPKTMIYRIR